jgi:hypothetical protein
MSEVYVLNLCWCDDVRFLSAWGTLEGAKTEAKRLCVSGEPDWGEIQNDEPDQWYMYAHHWDYIDRVAKYELPRGYNGDLCIYRIPFEPGAAQ